MDLKLSMRKDGCEDPHLVQLHPDSIWYPEGSAYDLSIPLTRSHMYLTWPLITGSAES